MGAVQDAGNTWLRDNVVEGDSGSGINEPSKSEGRAIFGLIEQAIADAVSAAVSAGGAAKLVLDISRDESTGLTTGAGKFSFRLPFGMLLSEVRASISTTSSSGDVKMDVNLEGVSILTDVVQIDATTTTSVGSAAPPAILTHELPDNGLITFDIDAAGTGAKGLKAYLIGSWAPFGVGAIPYFVGLGAGDGHSSGQAANPAYPTGFGLQTDDIAILQVMTQTIGGTGVPQTINRPSGWTLIANGVGPSGGGSPDVAAWFYKRLLGTEAGTVTVTSSGGDGNLGLGARMSIWRGCVANGDPFESAATDSGTAAAMTGTTIVTLGPNRLAVNLYSEAVTGDSDNDTGWTEAFDSGFTGPSFGQQYSASVAQMPTAGTTPPETRTLSGGFAQAWSSLSLALVPST